MAEVVLPSPIEQEIGGKICKISMSICRTGPGGFYIDISADFSRNGRPFSKGGKPLEGESVTDACVRFLDLLIEEVTQSYSGSNVDPEPLGSFIQLYKDKLLPTPA